MDGNTLFAANAVILLVMALAFLSAWRQQRSDAYWLSWIAGNVLLATALIGYIVLPAGITPLDFLPNCLLIAGFGYRWRAARQFAGSPTRGAAIVVPTLIGAALFVPGPGIEPGLIYAGINVILTAQTAAIARQFVRLAAGGRLPSSYALAGAYALIGLSFAIRALQGLAFMDDFASVLPRDAMLNFHLVVAVVHTVAAGVFALSMAYERAMAKLRVAAARDPLTGLFNRGAFDAELQSLLSGERGRCFALVLLDLDHFKAVNDAHGHGAGDAALQRCAALALETVGKTHFVARIGGEEFAILMRDVECDAVHAIVERLRRRVGGTEIVSGGARFTISMSAGVHHGRAGAEDFATVMRRADANLYAAKDGGRNRIVQSSTTGRGGGGVVLSAAAQPPISTPLKLGSSSA